MGRKNSQYYKKVQREKEHGQEIIVIYREECVRGVLLDLMPPKSIRNRFGMFGLHENV